MEVTEVAEDLEKTQDGKSLDESVEVLTVEALDQVVGGAIIMNKSLKG